MPIPGIQPQGSIKKKSSEDLRIMSGEEAVILEIDKKKKKITRAQIKKEAKRYAKYAKDMGYTNDEDQFGEEMSKIILNGFKKAAKIQKKH